MSTDRDKKCSERIYDEKVSLNETLTELFAKADSGEEDGDQELFEYGLGVSKKLMFKVELSWGGPSDWLEVVVSADGEHPDARGIESVTYHFADWFDHASLPVSTDEPAWRYAEWVIEGLT